MDLGLFRERTELAWTRTAISFAAVGAVMLKYRPEAGIPVLVVSPLIWRLGRLPDRPGSARAHGRRLLLITVITTAIGVAALVFSFVGGGRPA